MPPTLKTLATISARILFVAGCLALLIGMLDLLRAGSGETGAVARTAFAERLWGIAVISLFLSAVTAWFRRAMS